MSDVATVLGLVPGAIGGFCHLCVGHPMDLVKVRQQNQPISTVATAIAARSAATPSSILSANPNPNSTLSMIRTIVKSDGITGMYAGIQAPLLAVVPAFAVTFATYELAKSRLLQRNDGAQLTIGQTFVAGACSGPFNAMVQGPMERIKCLLQVDSCKPVRQYQGFRCAVQQLYQQGGVPSLCRGTLVTVLRDIPANAFYFATYEIVKRQGVALYYRNTDATAANTTRVPVAINLFAGGMAGIAKWIFTIPIDTVKSRWQVAPMGQYTSAVHVLRELLQKEGPRALFRGLTPAILKAFPANAACFLGVETVRSLLIRDV